MNSEPARLYRIQVGGKSGYIDAAGRVVIPPRYTSAGDFHEGLAVVGEPDPSGALDRVTNWVRQRVGVIDAAGNEVVPLQYDQIRDYAEGRAAFRSGKRYGFLDAGGSVVIQPIYDGAWEFSEGLATVQKGRAFAVIDPAGGQHGASRRHRRDQLQ